MVFPADKETFPVWVNKDLSIGEKGSDIDADIINDLRACVERIEDSLGYNFIEGYADLKARLASYVVALVTAKVKALDSAGLLLVDKDDIGIKINDGGNVSIQTSSNTYTLEVGGIGIRIGNNVGMNFSQQGAGQTSFIQQDYDNLFSLTNRTGDIVFRTSATSIERLKVYASGLVKLLTGSKLELVDEDIGLKGVGKGVIMTTPDGTKEYRVSVDNSGNVISTLIT